MHIAAQLELLVCPLADCELLHVQGHEGLSELFEYQLELAVPPTEKPLKALGNKLCCKITAGNDARLIHGHIVSIVQRDDNRWRLTVRPELAATCERRNLRVYQNLNVPDLVNLVLSDYGLSAKTNQLMTKYQEQSFWLQYQETDFQFISRLLERAGIHYFFRHEETAHTLVLVDHNGGYLSAPTELVWQEHWRETELNSLRGLEFHQSFLPADGPEESQTSWLDSAALPSLDPNGEQYKARAQSEKLTRAEERMSANEQLHANALALWPSIGQVVKLVRHPSLSGEYCVASLALDVRRHGEAPISRLCLSPKRLILRPQWRTPLPRIPGVIAATVVGPASEPVNVDKHGRVKIRFHWDEVQQKSDSPSCWVRVAQGWSGGSYGSFFAPRVGTEVLVSFIQGNPNAPVVTGTLYNERDLWPVKLPAEKLCSGIVTRSEPNGTAEQGHRFIFDDKKGQERIDLHSEKDLCVKTKNDFVSDITHTANITIGAGRSTRIKEGDDKLSVDSGNHHLTVKGDFVSDITNAAKLVIGTGRNTQIKDGDDSQSVDNGNYNLTVKGNYTQKLEGNHSVTSKGSGHLSTTSACTIESSEKIVLKVGASEISISASGITVKTPKLSMEGSASVSIKGAKVDVTADVAATLKGTKVDVVANAAATLKGTAMTIIDGALIKIG